MNPRTPLTGAVAGFAATAAMTGAMTLLFALLPRRERYPLPPVEVAVAAGLARGRRPELVVMALHFAYGAATGALFTAFGPTRRPAPVVGAAYGVGVWAASYFGWIPALGLLKPAQRHPPRRNALMIAAHLVWGATLAGVVRRLATPV